MEEKKEKKIIKIDDVKDYATIEIRDDQEYPYLFFMSRKNNGKYIKISQNNKVFDDYNFLYKGEIYTKYNFPTLIEKLMVKTVVEQVKKLDNTFVKDNIIDLNKIYEKYKLIISHTTSDYKNFYFRVSFRTNTNEYRFEFESLEKYIIKYNNKEYAQKNFYELFFDLLCKWRAHEFIKENEIDNFISQSKDYFEVDIYAIGYVNEYEGNGTYTIKERTPVTHDLFLKTCKIEVYDEYLKNESTEKLYRDIYRYIENQRIDAYDELYRDYNYISGCYYKAVAWYQGKKIVFNEIEW